MAAYALMAAAVSCSVCGSPDRDEIDAVLRRGGTIRSISRQFGFGRTALTNHHGRCLAPTMDPRSKTRLRGRRPAPQRITPVRLDSPNDVLEEYGRWYAEIQQLFELAKAARDLAKMEKAIAAGASLLDRFSKTFGMFADGQTVVNVNVDQRTSKIAAFLDALPPETMARLKSGEITIDSVLESAKEATP